VLAQEETPVRYNGIPMILCYLSRCFSQNCASGADNLRHYTKSKNANRHRHSPDHQ
jgi:hypothetical protein